MAKSAGLAESLFVSGVDISGDVGSVDTISARSGVLDVTAIDKAAHERILSHTDGEITFNHFFNDAAGQEFATLKAKGKGLEHGEQPTAGRRTDTSATNGSSLNNAASSALGLSAYLQVFSVVG